ncbi:hypothetical protein M422DRAFT_27837 [Sphaerobolus stellatus SS14]|nr:hypothetical protein M422DRAFT_27837 [Sphaerobolus stellatus SS14]
MNITDLQNQIEQLKVQNTRILKEHQKALQSLEGKFSYDDSTSNSSVKDNVPLKGQVMVQKREHRLGSQRDVTVKTASDSDSRVDRESSQKVGQLQRRLQEVEKAYAEDRKRHQGEIDKLKSELETRRKAYTEDTLNLRKQHESSEAKIRELKKATLADQIEIKNLRSKVQCAEQSKVQSASRQEELESSKRALKQLELKHKQELASRDLRISQQDKALAADNKRRDAVETRIADIKAKADTELKDAKERISKLLQDKQALSEAKEDAERLISQQREQIANLQGTLTGCAEAYGVLSSSSISVDRYRQSELTCISLRLRTMRLERRLADREAVIEELTDYCRQSSEEKALLRHLLREAEEHANTLKMNQVPFEGSAMDGSSVLLDFIDVTASTAQEQLNISRVSCDLARSTLDYYYEQMYSMLSCYSASEKENTILSSFADQISCHIAVLAADMEKVRQAKGIAEAELAQKIIEASEANVREEVLKQRLSVQKQELIDANENSKKERERNASLQQTWYRSRKNEEHLQLEVDRLSDELEDVSRYKDAHADLLSEVIELIQRNELAEEEAERLSKFNAEILGHQNPQQKICYVDRIRQELAETKHLLLKSTMDRDDLAANNTALLHEVAAYKSKAIPIDLKPQTTRVRVERPALASRNMNGSDPGIAFKLTPPPSATSSPSTISTPSFTSVPALMTLDELS